MLAFRREIEGGLMTGYLIALAFFAVVFWISGAYDKYFELASPLFLIYMAAIGPTFWTGEQVYKRQWNELDKRRRKAMKPGEVTEQELKIGEEMERLTAFNTTLTVGHLNRFKEELDQRLDELSSRLCSLERRHNPEDEDPDNRFGRSGP